MKEVFIALGTNLGDREKNLEAALRALAPAVLVKQVSPVYETAPWGFTDQPDFLNQVARVETGLDPLDLLKHLKRVEARMGRQHTFRNGPRLIDLDILLYGDECIQTERLIIPHPRMAERAFVLVPLADLAPDLVHPQLKKTIRDLLVGVDTSQARPYNTRQGV